MSKNTSWIYDEGGTSLLCLERTRLVTLNSVLQLSVAQHSVWSLFLAQELNAYISTVLRKHWHPLMLSFTRISSLCVREREKVCVRTRGGRSWLKFINFLLANGVPCAFFLLTNGTDWEVGGGCCLATAGRISDHVGPIVLSASLRDITCYVLWFVSKKHLCANASQSC